MIAKGSVPLTPIKPSRFTLANSVDEDRSVEEFAIVVSIINNIDMDYEDDKSWITVG